MATTVKYSVKTFGAGNYGVQAAVYRPQEDTVILAVQSDNVFRSNNKLISFAANGSQLVTLSWSSK